MRLQHKGETYYESGFDEVTGNVVRRVARVARYGDVPDVVQKRFPRRYHNIPSPSPEMVDIGITRQCSMGCTYCYQNSLPDGVHADKGLIEAVVSGFDVPPYQVAIGGGEPTLHPDLPWMLRRARELGTVPNYTTNGMFLLDNPELLAVTNEVCGGVALSFHANKGLEWFLDTYQRMRAALKCQLNVHLIADCNVARNLMALADAKIGPVNLVLLAYYPDVGRASVSQMMTRRTYTEALPEAVRVALVRDFRLAFSEGLLPYFLSRPELGLNADAAMASEGQFTCYVSPEGKLEINSFEDRLGDGLTVFTAKAQKLWEDLYAPSGHPDGAPCHDCEHQARCASHHECHALLCKYFSHNSLPLSPDDSTEPKAWFDRLDED